MKKEVTRKEVGRSYRQGIVSRHSNSAFSKGGDHDEDRERRPGGVLGQGERQANPRRPGGVLGRGERYSSRSIPGAAHKSMMRSHLDLTLEEAVVRLLQGDSRKELSVDTAIEAKEITKVYRGGVQALDGVSFRVGWGEIFG